MPGSSTRSARKRPTERDRADLWKRVGTFVRERREALGLSQGDIIRVLGYKSRNTVSNVEVGIEGLPAKRAYAWADVLELPRDSFFRFVTGEADRVQDLKGGANPDDGPLSAAESVLIATYRKLPPKYQRRLREQAEEFATLARATRSAKRK